MLHLRTDGRCSVPVSAVVLISVKDHQPEQDNESNCQGSHRASSPISTIPIAPDVSTTRQVVGPRSHQQRVHFQTTILNRPAAIPCGDQRNLSLSAAA